MTILTLPASVVGRHQRGLRGAPQNSKKVEITFSFLLWFPIVVFTVLVPIVVFTVLGSAGLLTLPQGSMDNCQTSPAAAQSWGLHFCLPFSPLKS